MALSTVASTSAAIDAAGKTQPLVTLNSDLLADKVGACALILLLLISAGVLIAISYGTPSTNRYTNKYTFSTTQKSFKDLIGQKRFKETMNTHFIPLKSKSETSTTSTDHHANFGITAANNLLLYGPPGCGKTHAAECLAGELDFAFHIVTTSDFGSPLVTQSSINIAQIFKAAFQLQNVLILFDDPDGSLGNRDQNSLSNNIIRNEYIIEMLKWLPSCRKNKVCVVFATNKLANIDQALIRAGRVDQTLEMNLPDEDDRKALLEHYLGRNIATPQEVLEIDYEKIAAITDGFTQADLETLSDISKREAAFKNLAKMNTDFVEEEITKWKYEEISKRLIREYGFQYLPLYKEKLENLIKSKQTLSLSQLAFEYRLSLR